MRILFINRLKTKVLGVTALFMIGLALPATAATFTATGGIQTFTVPTTGTYTIDVAGAQGGNAYNNYNYRESYSNNFNAYYNYNGGYGARLHGDFILTQGTQLSILVGTQAFNGYCGAGGGGGSYVYTGSTPYIIAGGGGGADNYRGAGVDASTNQNAACWNNSIASTIGYGGYGYYSGGGAGWLSNGSSSYNYGGYYALNGGGGGWGNNNPFTSNGGFGGGGAGIGDYNYGGHYYAAGGGGGGYTGGSDGGPDGGGGGGSYNAGTNQGTGSAQTGNGSVTINLTVPTSYTITTSTGTGSGSTTGNGSITSGSTANLIATPSTGYTFVNWTNNIGNPIVTTASFATPAITSNVTYTANFTLATPDTPSNIATSSINPTTIELSWSTTANATSYKIYQGTNLIGTSTTTSYTATSLQQSTSYSLSVSACNLTLEGNQSLPVLITTSQQVNSIQQTYSSQTLQSNIILTDGVNYYDPIAKQVYSISVVPGLSVARSANEYRGAIQAKATKIMILH